MESKRRSVLDTPLSRGMTTLCGAVPRNDGRTAAASTGLALARRRPVRFFSRAMRCSSRRGMSPPLYRASSFQALLKRIHQADDVVRPFLALGDLDRLAGGLAFDQGLQRILVLVLEFRWVEMRGLGVEDMAGEFDHVFRNLRILDVVEIFVFVAHFIGVAQRGAEQAL